MRTKTNRTNIIFKKRFFTLFVMLLLSGFGMFGQEVKSESAPVVITNNVDTASESNSQLEMVMWFMSSKGQFSNDSTTANTISTNGSGKKKFINCGATPNRILSRTFLKKAISRDFATA